MCIRDRCEHAQVPDLIQEQRTVGRLLKVCLLYTSLYVRGVDMLDGTPILDIKPYLSSIPAETLRRGWLAEAEARKA